ncbi:MFS transporter [Nocardioides yefusunii]|uniref:Nitrate/nitrite transporter n=1 Tax=Nocardioides yefusunii TaxID=2500546 RepID=A0ABW1QWY8_9ACTN|nr:MFS transporter [Nocardioides yefusunii]
MNSPTPTDDGRGAAAETMQPVQLHDLGRRRAWAVWGVAVAVYALAVFNRSSLGVAGLLAADRFDIAATQLASFTVLQLIVYAGMQVPVGVMLDRYGPKVLLLGGAALMTAAQLMFAYVHSYPMAVLARGLVGAGDAMVFITVIRVVNSWFRPRQVPMLTQVTGWVGQLGSIAAATPLTLLLTHYGWTSAFGATSLLGILLLVAVAVVVKDSPFGRTRPPAAGTEHTSVRSVWANPGTRLGFWVHFTTQCSFTVFALLWGVPFLVKGQGWSEVAAGTLLIGMTGWVILSGFVIGTVTTRLPFARAQIAIGVVVGHAVMWSVVILWPGQAPVAVILLLAAAVATGGPASVIGFDLARTFNPARQIGKATGLVNVGGFIASLTTMALIGIVLDAVEPDGTDFYELGDFKVAMCTQVFVWVLGIAMILRCRSQARAFLEREYPGAGEKLRAGESWTPPD